ncbi:hypothetical protein [Caldisphaera sp.]|uniref:hypothetical protein n=1 Tax=Caldisphaera sp. TaxID=2060322 RepID=UPI003D14949E
MYKITLINDPSNSRSPCILESLPFDMSTEENLLILALSIYVISINAFSKKIP